MTGSRSCRWIGSGRQHSVRRRRYGHRRMRSRGGHNWVQTSYPCSATRWLGISASCWVGMTGDGKGPAGGAIRTPSPHYRTRGTSPASTASRRTRLPGVALLLRENGPTETRRPPGGRNWVRTSDPSLVRRNKIGIAPSPNGRVMDLNCGNPAGRCPGVPGKVCTVVPASGSQTTTRDRDTSA
jgi:hypothetical protein